MDAIITFPNGELEEQIYMRQPVRYVVPGKEYMVCKLKKSLYELKQAPRSWNKTLHEYMNGLDSFRVHLIPVYIFEIGSRQLVAIIIEITEEMEKVKQSLKKVQNEGYQRVR